MEINAEDSAPCVRSWMFRGFQALNKSICHRGILTQKYPNVFLFLKVPALKRFYQLYRSVPNRLVYDNPGSLSCFHEADGRNILGEAEYRQGAFLQFT